MPPSARSRSIALLKMQNEVYKFGGASIKDAEGFKNVAKVIAQKGSKNLLIVVSAIADITNQLENVLKSYMQGDAETALAQMERIKELHFDIANDLLGEASGTLLDTLSNVLVEIEWILEEPCQDPTDYLYDQIVSIGELLSTNILSAYLNAQGQTCTWIDARNYIKTDNNYQNANVYWNLTIDLIRQDLLPLLDQRLVLTQGFIGSSSENFSTTLGREGSDYSASLFCAAIEGASVTIWKDVPGVLNADPRWFDDTVKIPDLSYQDAIELSYYGATVIHPKTIKPLQNQGIPLYVRSFKDIQQEGTKIHEGQNPLPIPSFIFKIKQVLISISSKDFSFIIEEHLSQIFSILHKHKLSVNMMHNSALSFSVSVDYHPSKIESLIDELKTNFRVKYNENLELVTIRYYDQATLDRITVGKTILLEVKSRYTCQMVMKDVDAV